MLPAPEPLHGLDWPRVDARIVPADGGSPLVLGDVRAVVFVTSAGWEAHLYTGSGEEIRTLSRLVSSVRNRADALVRSESGEEWQLRSAGCGC